MLHRAPATQTLNAYPERRPDADGVHAPRQSFAPFLGEGGAMSGDTRKLLRAVRARRSARSAGPEIDRARAIAAELRGPRATIRGAAACFALLCDLVEKHLGFRPHDEQLAGAWHLMCGQLIEMDTGEGKSVTAVLAAATQALMGRSVHVITVNDYLAERDAHEMRPIYADLGLSAGAVRQGMSNEERWAIYRSAIVYVTPKQLMFDYLRDGIRLGSAAGSPLRSEIAVLRSRPGGANDPGFYLPGLQVAIVDEADSVLIDEAVVPLIISKQEVDEDQAAIATDAIYLAQQLNSGLDYILAPHGRDLVITDAGRSRLETLAKPIGGVFGSKIWREQYCEQALMALHLFRRDRDYILRDGIIEIVDANTGRTMPDRTWERGLHQMIQAKEELDITAPNESIARISHQAFFQRYLHLCGMSGTLREVAKEIREVYDLEYVRIPPHRRSLRRHLGTSISRTIAAKDDRVVKRIAAVARQGRAVLVGTRSVSDSERLSTRLEEAGIPHRLLNARRDDEEAAIIAKAGEMGAVTVATSMAGRGTDIKLDPAVKAKGGLHVITTERHDSRRIDRQLFGRAARQGDPGSCEEILSLEDDVLLRQLPRYWMMLAKLPIGLRKLLMRSGQYRASRAARRVRDNLGAYELQMNQALSFARR